MMKAKREGETDRAPREFRGSQLGREEKCPRFFGEETRDYSVILDSNLTLNEHIPLYPHVCRD